MKKTLFITLILCSSLYAEEEAATTKASVLSILDPIKEEITKLDAHATPTIYRIMNEFVATLEIMKNNQTKSIDFSAWNHLVEEEDRTKPQIDEEEDSEDEVELDDAEGRQR